MTDDTRALIEEAKRYHSAMPDRLRCAFCLGTWPCLVSRLADALEAAQKDSELLDALQAEHERVDPIMALVLKQYYDRNGSEWVNVAGNVRRAITDALAVGAAALLARAEPNTKEEDTDNGK